MIKKIFLLCVLCVFTRSLFAQQLIPRQIFVGDYATLIIPFTAPATTTTIIKTTEMPQHKYVDFHQISLMPDRLIIEFSAYAPGELEFPLIEIGGHYFPNLKVSVSSLIDRREAITLSSPATSLAMPGTAAMLYGAMAGIVFLLIAVIWFFARGKKLLALWKEKWIRWQLFTNMRHTERRLYRAVLKKVDTRVILNKLSQEFRSFLSILLNKNCRAMTAQELNNDIITRCDDFRFSGTAAAQDKVMRLLADLHHWLDTTEAAQKEAKK